ncbi:zinc finger protein 836-like [Eriocheir sinensis]|uniref:zinc finger protein 836-like n=1 Tax=Eriocheir sinensis TaxID=95602 RepID=UPI0021C6BC91|nr:zinc finger protein 836-like [Eriocheir sinensis]XP_050738014.1 zinc finger protein 836-like [Eriocheir sinensis]XP_050738015.1 zinc finger protein 836-like [Eriocheir sinensis]
MQLSGKKQNTLTTLLFYYTELDWMAELIRKNIHQCKACGCSFSRNTNLQQHMTTHTPEENMLYGDIFSHNTFTIQNEMQRPKQKIACPVCPRIYVFRGNYIRHLITAHGIIEKNGTPYSGIHPKVGNRQGDQDVSERETVKAPDSSRNHVFKSGKNAHFGPLNLEQEKKVKKRGRPPKGRCRKNESVKEVGEGVTVEAVESSKSLVVRSEKEVHFGPVNPEQAKKVKKRGRPPKGRFCKNESVKEIDEGVTVKASETSKSHVVRSEKELLLGPLNPEQVKKVKKRGRPPKRMCFENESVKEVDEEGIVKAPETSKRNVVKSEKKVHFGPLKPEQAKNEKRRPLKQRYLDKESVKKKYECPECKKRMTQSSTLLAHMRIHTGERPYRCLVCCKTFTFYQCLWNHSWRHKDMKSFPCDRCPRTYRYYQCLWTHYKTHTHEKLFTCAVCKLRFATSVQLNRHRKKHPEKREGDHKNNRSKCLKTAKVNERPFKCKVCAKKYRLKISLVSHEEKCYSKTQLSLNKNSNCNGPSDILVKSGTKGVDQNQKRGRGRPRKFTKPTVERKVFVDPQTLEYCYRKQQDTCFACKKVNKNCVCHDRCRGKNKENRKMGKSRKCNGYKKTTEALLRISKRRNEKKIAEPLLRKSKRLKREKSVVSGCETYDQPSTGATEQNHLLNCRPETKPYSCSHCSKSFKSQTWLSRHRNLAHSDTQKETSHTKRFKNSRFRKKQRNKSVEYKCSCCGTVFISNDDYKKHTAFVSCLCGQQFHCGYIFCFHTSTCGKHDVSVTEERGDQNSEDTNASSSKEGNFPCQQDTWQPETNSKSSQMYPNCIPLVTDSNDSALLPSSDHYQSEEWVWQLLNTAERELVANGIIIETEPNVATEAAENPQFDQENFVESELQNVPQPDQEADICIQSSRKLPGNRQKFQCIICSQGFFYESELASHSLSHMKDSF